MFKEVKAKGHTPQYRMHKYYARRPFNVFNNIIQHFSKEGDIILDSFCGGGVTIFEACSLGRKAIGVDINPLATFITKMQLFNDDLDNVSRILDDFVNNCKKKYNNYYFIKTYNDAGFIDWVEWAYVVACPLCQSNIILSESNKIRNGVYKCPKSSCKGTKGIKRVNAKPVSSIPLRIKYTSSIDSKPKFITDVKNVRKYLKDIESEDVEIEDLVKPDFQIPMDWDRQYEDRLLEKGIIHYSDFFTKRNYTINTLIFNDLLKLKLSYSEHIIDYIYFLFSSSIRYTNNMTRVTDNWEGGNPTSMDKHAFWLPNQYIETNIINVLEKRKKAIIKGFKYSYETLPINCIAATNFSDLKSDKNYLLINSDASKLNIPDSSIDVVITDPPYGSNVQYAELSTIWNAWFMLYQNLDNYIYKTEEAVVNRKSGYDGAKDEEDYEDLLYKVFEECFRVLKEDALLIFTFNNKNIKVWIAMLKAVTKAGFYLPEDGIIFQDFISSYKNTAHLRFSGNIHGDFVYTFKKGKNKIRSKINDQSFEIILKNQIDMAIKNIFVESKSFSTPELYEVIFTSMVTTLMNHISSSFDNNIAIDVSKLSNDYIMRYLKQKLNYDNGNWSKR